MKKQQKPVQEQTMTSQPVSEELRDDQLEQVSGGMGKVGKLGIVGAGLLGAGALAEGGIALHQKQQALKQNEQSLKQDRELIDVMNMPKPTKDMFNSKGIPSQF